jgi:hypothetical protein
MHQIAMNRLGMLSIPDRAATGQVLAPNVITQATEITHPNSAKVGQTHSFNLIGYSGCTGEIK